MPDISCELSAMILDALDSHGISSLIFSEKKQTMKILSAAVVIGSLINKVFI